MPAEAHLAALSWPEIDERVVDTTILAIPLGATEQHGPHLPLSVDTWVATRLCAGLAAARREVLVAPPLPYGASGEHADFPGTLSIGHEALCLVLLELARSATDTVARVVFVSGHGGNAAALRKATVQARAEGRDVTWFEPRWNGDPHAGRPETALMLAMRPEVVRMERAAAGETAALHELAPRLRAEGVRAVSPSGVLGDPRGASAADGAALLERLTADLLAHVDAWSAEPGPVPEATQSRSLTGPDAVRSPR